MKNLLPHSSKKIGWIIALLPLLILITIRLISKETIEGNKDFFRKITMITILLGLLLVILTRQKKDDEYINHCRLNAFSFAFLVTIISGAINLSGAFNGEKYTVFGILLFMEVVYLVIFNLQLRNTLVSDK